MSFLWPVHIGSVEHKCWHFSRGTPFRTSPREGTVRKSCMLEPFTILVLSKHNTQNKIKKKTQFQTKSSMKDRHTVPKPKLTKSSEFVCGTAWSNIASSCCHLLRLIWIAIGQVLGVWTAEMTEGMTTLKLAKANKSQAKLCEHDAATSKTIVRRLNWTKPPLPRRLCETN